MGLWLAKLLDLSNVSGICLSVRGAWFLKEDVDAFGRRLHKLRLNNRMSSVTLLPSFEAVLTRTNEPQW